MLKVLSLVPDYVEKPSGGLGEQYRNIRNHLIEHVDYFTVGYPEKNKIENYRGASAPFYFPHASLTTIMGQSVYFLEALKFKQSFDLIHAFDWSTFYAGYLCKSLLNIPLICTMQLSLEQLNKSGIYYCHDKNSIDGIHINQLQVYLEELGLISADRVIHVSNYYESLFPDYKQKSSVVANGIDIKQWKKKREPRLPGKNKLKFCYIGRSSPMKGLDIILNSEIPNNIDFYFVVSSKNAEEPYFSQIKKKANGVNIFHIPGLYGQDKIDFLFSMDGVVMPSMHEPFGIVALEALISENLFITTASGGIQEIVDGIDYFKIQSSQELTKAFETIKDMSQDEMHRIKQTGKLRAQKYDWSIPSNMLLQIYNTTIKNWQTDQTHK